LDHNIVFKKSASIVAQNGRKSPKIVIITWTPGIFDDFFFSTLH
jgi:hypothetical protein